MLWRYFFLLQRTINWEFQQLRRSIQLHFHLQLKTAFLLPWYCVFSPPGGHHLRLHRQIEVLRVRPVGWVPGEGRAGVFSKTCRAWAGRLLGADTSQPSLSGCMRAVRLREAFQDSCVKGKALTPPRLNSDRGSSARIPHQATESGGNCIFH